MKRAVLFAAGALFAVSVFAQGIKDLDNAWVKAAKAGDVEGLVKLYAPTAVTYMPDEMKAKGTAEIRASFQKFLGIFLLIKRLRSLVFPSNESISTLKKSACLHFEQAM